MSKLIFLLGATCSGKTAMSLELAISLPNCCVINCDSRQIYRDFDIISAKVKGKWRDGVYFVDYKNEQVPHFLIDFATFENFGILDYLEAFDVLNLSDFENVLVVGGTGYWAKSLLEFVNGNYQVCKNSNQVEFEAKKQQLSQLNLNQLKEVYPNYKLLNASDSQNPIRIINKILEASFPVKLENKQSTHRFDQICQFLIDKKLEDLPILSAVKSRFEAGLLLETQILKQKYSIEKLLQFGLEYKNLLISKPFEDLVSQSFILNRQYAKRQITWFKKQNLISITNTDQILQMLYEVK